MPFTTITQPALSFGDFFWGFIDYVLGHPLALAAIVVTAVVILVELSFRFAEASHRKAMRKEMPDPIPYEPRSFSKPAPKGFQREHQGTVVSMQARKRDGNEAA